MNVEMKNISPELALVDPDLAREARALLPEPGDCLASRISSPALRVAPSPLVPPRPRAIHGVRAKTPPEAVIGLSGVPPASDESVQRRSRRPRGSGHGVDKRNGNWDGLARLLRPAAAGAAWATILALVSSPLLAFIPPADSARPRLLAPSDDPLGMSGGATPVPVEKPGGQDRPLIPAPSHSPALPAPAANERPPLPRRSPVPSRSGKPSAHPPRPGGAGQKQIRLRPAAPSGKAGHGRVTTNPTPARLTIRWPAVAGAVVYNLILVREGERVDSWPRANHVVVQPPRSAGQVSDPVEYRWFAYPGFRRDGVLRYGPLVAHGAVFLPAGSVKSGIPPRRSLPS